jgi:homoaconitase/3-isopropylmalate dehydratase large subunit
MALGQILLYVDRTILNEYTSPQAFSGLREAERKVWNPTAALMVVDHVNPTAARRTRDMPDADAAAQVDYFGKNARDFGRLLSGFGVVIGGSCDQGSDEGAEQSLSPPPGVVDELKEAKVGGQLLL